MPARRRSGDRGTRPSDRRKRKRASVKQRRARRQSNVKRHPLFGDIPLIPFRFVDASGRERELLEYDPDYRPDLPPGAVRGDVRRQLFCPMCNVPKYFYVDEQRTCVQCGSSFVFAADEQKYWYETLQFNFGSTAIRCVPCRRKRRSESALRAQIAAAKAGLRANRDDPTLLIALAEATARYHQRSGQGNLDAAIAAARRAIKRWPGGVEALFWEAVCQAEAGRRAKARALFTEFAERAPGGKRFRELRSEARRFLEEDEHAA